jgi:hypothetical protein
LVFREALYPRRAKRATGVELGYTRAIPMERLSLPGREEVSVSPFLFVNFR